MRISIIIPVFNEGVNLDIILRVIEAVVTDPHETLVVYDFPEDDSVPVAAVVQKDHPAIRLVHNTIGRGAINAIKAGVAAARGTYAVTLMADDIGPVFALSAMADLMDQGCGLVGCTRYARGGRVFGGSPIQKILSRTANGLFRLLSPSKLTDATFGPKMFRPETFKTLSIESKSGWAISFELSIKIQELGMQVGEIPITSINRFYGGTSSFSLGGWFVEYTWWFLRGVRALRKVRKTLPPLLRKRAFE